MSALLFIAALAFQDAASIQDVRTLTDGYARSGCWLPLKVRVTGRPGLNGTLITSSDSGVRVSRPFQMPGSGSADIILPALFFGRDAKIEVTLRVEGAAEVRKELPGTLKLNERDRLVLIDPRHPEFDSLSRETITLPRGAKVVFVASEPGDWNEAAEMGALEIVDAVIPTEERALDLTMTVWRALGGALVTQPRAGLIQRLEEPAARFPAIDSQVARFTVSEKWVSKKREAAMLFVVIFGFSFFVAVFVTWSRKGGAWPLLASALGVTTLFVAAYNLAYPKGNLAVRSWQAIVEAPETPVAITISALWGSGERGEVSFGRIVKPVYATLRDASRVPLEMRWSDARWTISGVAPGDPTRFVTVDRLNAIEPWKAFKDSEGKPQLYKAEESEYYLRVPRKRSIRLQDPQSLILPPIEAPGLIETAASRVFRVEIRP